MIKFILLRLSHHHQTKDLLSSRTCSDRLQLMYKSLHLGDRIQGNKGRF
ncbi:hypothetical protein [Chroococcidiopsis sp. CCNUC1]|nr:hypothetical protein [Chroococcidiopsis sp. CCNUC1]URD50643.1 hypothetical protein M5J74_01325 [Chroococcidiopsis sp. CCNUC1]